MRPLFRHALSSLLIVAASNASAGVITQDGVVFTSTYLGNVLTLEIDAAKRSGGWAAASAIDALSIKTVGSFSGVTMSSSSGTSWSLAPSELNARGCAAAKGRPATSMTRLCYSGAGIGLEDNMVFTFTFTGIPELSAPHLKVHFVDANGVKAGSLLSLDFPWQAATPPVGGQTGSSGSTGPIGPTQPTQPTQPSQPTSPIGPTEPTQPPQPTQPTGSTGSTGGQASTGGSQAGGPAPELIPVPVVTLPVTDANGPIASLPVDMIKDEDASEVPEPRTLGLMAAGLLTLGVARRRK